MTIIKQKILFKTFKLQLSIYHSNKSNESKIFLRYVSMIYSFFQSVRNKDKNVKAKMIKNLE